VGWAAGCSTLLVGQMTCSEDLRLFQHLSKLQKSLRCEHGDAGAHQLPKIEVSPSGGRRLSRSADKVLHGLKRHFRCAGVALLRWRTTTRHALPICEACKLSESS